MYCKILCNLNIDAVEIRDVLFVIVIIIIIMSRQTKYFINVINKQPVKHKT